VDVARDAMFPKLSAAQIARLVPLGARRSFNPGEMIADQGSAGRSLFVVLEGRLEVVSPTKGGETHITAHEPGQFTGEVNMLAGRPSLVRTRAAAASELLEIDQPTLRHIVQKDPELSEIFLRAFLRRRSSLIEHAAGDLLLIGSQFSADTLRLKEFLAGNGHPYSFIEVERDPGVQDLFEH
jgi:thioredoxin reductase (NADPH)